MRRESQCHWQIAVRTLQCSSNIVSMTKLALRNSLFHVQSKIYKWQIIKHNGIYSESNETIFLEYYRGNSWFDVNLGIQWLYWHDSDFLKRTWKKFQNWWTGIVVVPNAVLVRQWSRLFCCVLCYFSHPCHPIHLKHLPPVLFAVVKAIVPHYQHQCHGN